MRHAVIVTAAGTSCRFNENSNSSQKKEFCKIDNDSVLYKAVEPFLKVDGLCSVVITYKAGTLEETKKAVEKLSECKGISIAFVEGGATRQKSVFNALKSLEKTDIDYVSIHDGARPFVTTELIERTLAQAERSGASAPVLKVSDTLVRTDENGMLCGKVDRTGVARIQTPQIFKFPDILDAHKEALKSGKTYTDDTWVFIDYGREVATVDGDENNIKITYRKDLC